MREIKFRAKRKYQDIWEYGDLVHDAYGKTFIEKNMSKSRFSQQVDPETIGQFTGLYDKENNPIYEGDVIKDQYGGIGYVVWFDYMWAIKSPGSEAIDETWQWSEFKVITNRFDNPELLEQ